MLNKKILISFFIVLSLNANDNNISIIVNQGVPAINEMLKKISIQKRYKQNRTLLHYAVKARNFDTVSFLVRKKILLSLQGGKYNNTALQDAIFNGHLKIAHYLIKKGTPLNLKNRYGETALHIASTRGYIGVIKQLLLNGADKSIMNNNGHKPYDLIKKLSFTSSKKLKELLFFNQNSVKRKKYREFLFIDKKSKINNCNIGIQIKE